MTWPAWAAAVGELCEHQHWCVQGDAAPVLSVPEQTQSQLPLIPPCILLCRFPSQKAEEIKPFTRWVRSTELPVCSAQPDQGLPLAVWDSRSPALQKDSNSSQEQAKSLGLGSSGAGIFQEVSKSLRAFSRLALFGLVKMGKSFRGQWQSPECSRAELWLPRKLPLSSISLTPSSDPVWSWHTSGTLRALQHSAVVYVSAGWGLAEREKGRGL